VLLEDVDSAGINREKEKHVIMTKDSLIDDTSDYGEGDHGVTLLALLNAIDGIASNEARILIMSKYPSTPIPLFSLMYAPCLFGDLACNMRS